MDEAALAAMLGGLVGGADGDWVAEPMARYRARYPEASPAELFALVFNDFAIMCAPHVAEAKLRAATAPVYSYLFSWGRPGIGAPHGSELTFLFDHLSPALPPYGPTMRDHVVGAWVAFARDGDPNHATLPRWEPYEMGTRAMMRFDDPARLRARSHRRRPRAVGRHRHRPLMGWVTAVRFARFTCRAPGGPER